MANLLRLRGADRLAAVVAGSDVRMILSGHAHYTGCGQFAGVPVWIGPAVAYHSDAMPPRGRLRGRAGGGFSRIDLVAGQFVATAVSVAPAREVYNHDRETRYRFLKSLTPKVG